MSEGEDGEVLCLESDCEASGRIAIVSDEGDSVWLYLTRTSGDDFERDCWLFNKPSAPGMPDLDRYQADSVPPPAPAEYIDAAGTRECPSEERFQLQWSDDGESALLLLDGVPLGLVSSQEEHGVSRYLLRESGWGRPWDGALVQRLFPAHSRSASTAS
jgi:hypothetical protein